ncbi:MAG TPA: hypothetical protein PLV06_04785 [Bacteroidales bacterium]|nr:hypothetical protein [Bacteroidales bacterium]HPJ58503.1 hypothetical protein [Bacteroidales bacterium]HPR11678.1 hypothetical protein [Bacteroidales bacterium]HRW85513.1 hypothetical protein [Bacteroidales bacterium]
MKRTGFKKITSAFLLAAACCMPASLVGQATSKGEMPQYLFPSFTKCNVLMKTGTVNTAVMNYNTVTEKMVFVNNEKYYDMTNPEAADTIYLNDRKFVPVGKAFYEVVVNEPVALYIQHKGSLMSAGKTVGYGGTSQTASATYISNIELSGLQYNLTLPSDYIVNPAPVYWIRINATWHDFINEKQFLAIFPDKSSEIKNFIRQNRIKIDRPGDLKRLVEHCSAL